MALLHVERPNVNRQDNQQKLKFIREGQVEGWQREIRSQAFRH